MYTGYIVNTLYLVDFSEPLGLMIGPSFYLMALSVTRPPLSKKYYWHFAFPLLYFVLLIPFLLQPDVVKYNSWVGAYKVPLPFKEYHYHGNPRVFWLTDHATEFILTSIVLYTILLCVEVLRFFKQKGISFWRPGSNAFKYLRNHFLVVVSTVLLLLIVKAINQHDTGDHIFATFIAVSIYLTSFQVMQHSHFFKQSSAQEAERYKSSTLSGEGQQMLLKKLDNFMIAERPYLSPDFSLPELAQKLGTSVHILSQVINVGLRKSFFEMTAEYRVEEAKKMLIEYNNIKVEEIAEQVGYNSKSSFNTAFKKMTGKTPSEYRRENAKA